MITADKLASWESRLDTLRVHVVGKTDAETLDLVTDLEEVIGEVHQEYLDAVRAET